MKLKPFLLEDPIKAGKKHYSLSRGNGQCSVLFMDLPTVEAYVEARKAEGLEGPWYVMVRDQDGLPPWLLKKID